MRSSRLESKLCDYSASLYKQWESEGDGVGKQFCVFASIPSLCVHECVCSFMNVCECDVSSLCASIHVRLSIIARVCVHACMGLCVCVHACMYVSPCVYACEHMLVYTGYLTGEISCRMETVWKPERCSDTGSHDSTEAPA